MPRSSRAHNHNKPNSRDPMQHIRCLQYLHYALQEVLNPNANCKFNPSLIQNLLKKNLSNIEIQDVERLKRMIDEGERQKVDYQQRGQFINYDLINKKKWHLDQTRYLDKVGEEYLMESIQQRQDKIIEQRQAKKQQNLKVHRLIDSMHLVDNQEFNNNIKSVHQNRDDSASNQQSQNQNTFYNPKQNRVQVLQHQAIKKQRQTGKLQVLSQQQVPTIQAKNSQNLKMIQKVSSLQSQSFQQSLPKQQMSKIIQNIPNGEQPSVVPHINKRKKNKASQTSKPQNQNQKQKCQKQPQKKIKRKYNRKPKSVEQKSGQIKQESDKLKKQNNQQPNQSIGEGAQISLEKQQGIQHSSPQKKMDANAPQQSSQKNDNSQSKKSLTQQKKVSKRKRVKKQQPKNIIIEGSDKIIPQEQKMDLEQNLNNKSQLSVLSISLQKKNNQQPKVVKKRVYKSPTKKTDKVIQQKNQIITIKNPQVIQQKLSQQVFSEVNKIKEKYQIQQVVLVQNSLVQMIDQKTQEKKLQTLQKIVPQEQQNNVQKHNDIQVNNIHIVDLQNQPNVAFDLEKQQTLMISKMCQQSYHGQKGPFVEQSESQSIAKIISNQSNPIKKKRGKKQKNQILIKKKQSSDEYNPGGEKKSKNQIKQQKKKQKMTVRSSQIEQKQQQKFKEFQGINKQQELINVICFLNHQMLEKNKEKKQLNKNIPQQINPKNENKDYGEAIQVIGIFQMTKQNISNSKSLQTTKQQISRDSNDNSLQFIKILAQPINQQKFPQPKQEINILDLSLPSNNASFSQQKEQKPIQFIDFSKKNQTDSLEFININNKDNQQELGEQQNPKKLTRKRTLQEIEQKNLDLIGKDLVSLSKSIEQSKQVVAELSTQNKQLLKEIIQMSHENESLLHSHKKEKDYKCEIHPNEVYKIIVNYIDKGEQIKEDSDNQDQQQKEQSRQTKKKLNEESLYLQSDVKYDSD